MSENNLSLATIGGGCFWCTEAVFEKLEGVHQVVSGYSGGQVIHPTYEQVCAKNTGHAEVIQITYDAKIISFAELLEVFWTTHDPTTPDQQGNDKGPQYRSVIYYHDDDQKLTAQKSIKTVASTLYDQPIVTEIAPIDIFYPAELNHQNFYRLNPDYGYCKFVIDPKVSKLRSKFAHKLKNRAS